MTKKIFAIFTLVCILFSVFAVSAAADELPLSEAVTEFTAEEPTESPTGVFINPNSFNSEMKYHMFFLLIVVVLFYFETLLSRNENKIVGLIIPVLTFIGMSITTFVFAFGAEKFSVVSLVITLLLMNIPTIVMFLIYRSGRKKYEKESKK